MIFYRVFARLQKKDLRKERSATNDLKFISRVGLGEDDDGMRLVEARSRSEKLDAVLLLDVDDENVASEAAAMAKANPRRKRA